MLLLPHSTSFLGSREALRARRARPEASHASCRPSLVAAAASPGPGLVSFGRQAGPGLVSFRGAVAVSPAPSSPLARLRGFLGDGDALKAKLATLGASALLAYGFVSNVNAVVRCRCSRCSVAHFSTISVTPAHSRSQTLLIVAWVSFAAKTGLSPLAAGQWPAYLLSYTALYAVIGNGLRPLRFSLSVAITPFFDRFVAFLSERLHLSQRQAFAACVFLVNVLGTCSYLVLGLRLATLVAGVPFLPA